MLDGVVAKEVKVQLQVVREGVLLHQCVVKIALLGLIVCIL